MNRFFMIVGMVCLLAFAGYGCGEEPDGKGAKSETGAASNMTTAAKEIASEAAEAVTQTATEGAESAEETTAEVTAAAEEMVSDATEKLSPSPAPCAVGDIIEMKTADAFSVHKMGIVMFSHGKHAAPAPGGYGVTCGECHHDENGAPLELTEGDPVQGCMECHDKAEKPNKPEGISKEDWNALQLEYYYGAIHANCIDCHKAGGAGPVKCAECHLKPEK